MMIMGTGNKWDELTAFVRVKGILALEQPSSAYFRSLLQVSTSRDESNIFSTTL
jgi:hypothetical protein